HKPAPDVPGAQIFGAEQRDSNVYANHVGINPSGLRIERVGETVTAIDFFTELLAHCPQGRERDLRRKHQGTACSTRHDRTINLRMARWPAPGHVSFGAI